MAATRLIALHINKGKTVAQCLRERTDYAQNPEKTAKGDLVTSYQCDPMTAVSAHHRKTPEARGYRLPDSPVIQAGRDYSRRSKSGWV